MQSLTYAALAFDAAPKFCWQGLPGVLRIATPLRLCYWAFSNPLIVLVVGEVVGAPSWLLLAAAGVTAMVSLFGLGLELGVAVIREHPHVLHNRLRVRKDGLTDALHNEALLGESGPENRQVGIVHVTRAIGLDGDEPPLDIELAGD
jgi:hypothetical protein